MLKSIPWFCVLTAMFFSLVAGAQTLCEAKDKNVAISIRSATCKADPCMVKFEAGRLAYFEFHPTDCTSTSQDFSIQVTPRTGKATPQMKSCDGNATCPDHFNQDGVTPAFTAQGKTWGRIRY
ncbi:MAG: hypothetical protein K2W33_04785 [Burkholderiales bacterium]|nr:hypothetical protein [Burkholderiales bacterium]